MSNTDVVMDFIGAWNARDFDRMLGFFSDESIYHNLPYDPVTGTEAIRGVLESFFNMGSEIDWVVHAISETADGKVLTERSDRFLINGKWLDLPVMGIFEIDGTTITGWRDYFDGRKFEADMARISAA